MHIARFLCPWLPRQWFHKRRLPLHQVLQARLHGPNIRHSTSFSTMFTARNHTTGSRTAWLLAVLRFPGRQPRCRPFFTSAFLEFWKRPEPGFNSVDGFSGWSTAGCSVVYVRGEYQHSRAVLGGAGRRL